MNAYLIQHGIATSKDEDPERPLTDAGRREVERVMDRVAPAMDAARVLHSGKLRARQTAEIVAERLGVEADEWDNLSPNADPAIWRERLAGSQDDVVLVGHLPHLELLAAGLLCGRRSPVIRFRNGGVVCLERDADGGWAVQWVVTPEVT